MGAVNLIDPINNEYGKVMLTYNSITESFLIINFYISSCYYRHSTFVLKIESAVGINLF